MYRKNTEKFLFGSSEIVENIIALIHFLASRFARQKNSYAARTAERSETHDFAFIFFFFVG